MFDIIHFGTWLRCAAGYDATGCHSYDRATGRFTFNPRYAPLPLEPLPPASRPLRPRHPLSIANYVLGAITACLAPAAPPASVHCKLCRLRNIISMYDPRRGGFRYDPDTVTFRGYNETTEVRFPAML